MKLYKKLVLFEYPHTQSDYCVKYVTYKIDNLGYLSFTWKLVTTHLLSVTENKIQLYRNIVLEADVVSGKLGPPISANAWNKKMREILENGYTIRDIYPDNSGVFFIDKEIFDKMVDLQSNIEAALGISNFFLNWIYISIHNQKIYRRLLKKR